MENLFTFYAQEKNVIKYTIEADTLEQAIESFEEDSGSGSTVSSELENYAVYDEQQQQWVKGC